MKMKNHEQIAVKTDVVHNVRVRFGSNEKVITK